MTDIYKYISIAMSDAMLKYKKCYIVTTRLKTHRVHFIKHNVQILYVKKTLKVAQDLE